MYYPDAAEKIIQLETDYMVDYIKGLAHYNHDVDNVGAAASGSFETIGVVVVPCSIKTLSGIANSFSANLMIRVADVTLKERRKLVLMIGDQNVARILNILKLDSFKRWSWADGDKAVDLLKKEREKSLQK